jgi:hypothetical protein
MIGFSVWRCVLQGTRLFICCMVMLLSTHPVRMQIIFDRIACPVLRGLCGCCVCVLIWCLWYAEAGCACGRARDTGVATNEPWQVADPVLLMARACVCCRMYNLCTVLHGDAVKALPLNECLHARASRSGVTVYL